MSKLVITIENGYKKLTRHNGNFRFCIPYLKRKTCWAKDWILKNGCLILTCLNGDIRRYTPDLKQYEDLPKPISIEFNDDIPI